MKNFKALPFTLCILISAAAIAADNTDAIMMDASLCLKIVSPIERLACFEEQARSAQERDNTTQQQNLPMVSIPRHSTQQPAQPSPQVQPQPASEAPQVAVKEVLQETESASMTTADSFEQNFGLPKEKVNTGKEKAKTNELVARVANIKQIGMNLVRITLENGQEWEQMETRRFALAEGDEVRIYPTRWGSSYRLASLSHKGFIQVKRLR